VRACAQGERIFSADETLRARTTQFVAGPRGVLEIEVLRVFVLVGRGWLQK